MHSPPLSQMPRRRIAWIGDQHGDGGGVGEDDLAVERVAHPLGGVRHGAVGVRRGSPEEPHDVDGEVVAPGVGEDVGGGVDGRERAALGGDRVEEAQPGPVVGGDEPPQLEDPRMACWGPGARTAVAWRSAREKRVAVSRASPGWMRHGASGLNASREPGKTAAKARRSSRLRRPWMLASISTGRLATKAVAAAAFFRSIADGSERLGMENKSSCNLQAFF